MTGPAAVPLARIVYCFHILTKMGLKLPPQSLCRVTGSFHCQMGRVGSTFPGAPLPKKTPSRCSLLDAH